MKITEDWVDKLGNGSNKIDDIKYQNHSFQPNLAKII